MCAMPTRHHNALRVRYPIYPPAFWDILGGRPIYGSGSCLSVLLSVFHPKWDIFYYLPKSVLASLPNRDLYIVSLIRMPLCSWLCLTHFRTYIATHARLVWAHLDCCGVFSKRESLSKWQSHFSSLSECKSPPCHMSHTLTAFF